MKKLLLLALLPLFASSALAQTCAQTLRLARATYEQGRLHEIEEQLQGCLKSPEQGGFSKDEKQLRVEAYRILCLSYIYLEEPQKADEAMLNLKRTDPYYAPNPDVDAAEFVALYNTFRKDPIYRFGFTLGGNFSIPNVQEQLTAIELTDDSEYKAAFAIQLGAAFDVPLNFFKEKRWTLHTELLYAQNKFEIDQKEVQLDPNTDPSAEPGQNEFEGIETHSRVALPVLVQYQIVQRNENQKYKPYVALGVTPDYLVSSKMTVIRTKAGLPGVPEKTEDLNPQREAFQLAATAAIGVKAQAGPGNFVLEIRYNYGLTNVSSAETALQNQSLALDYGYVDPVFNLQSLSFSLSYLFNKHNPKKLFPKP
jgi:hypothetical protein